MDMCTTSDEDREGIALIGEAFEAAVAEANERGQVAEAHEYVDYDVLWEKVCKVLGVST